MYLLVKILITILSKILPRIICIKDKCAENLALPFQIVFNGLIKCVQLEMPKSFSQRHLFFEESWNQISIITYSQWYQEMMFMTFQYFWITLLKASKLKKKITEKKHEKREEKFSDFEHHFFLKKFRLERLKRLRPPTRFLIKGLAD